MINSRKQNEFLTFILQDVFEGIPGITSRAMFGGYGIYRDGIIFALIAYNQLCFKVGESNRSEYEAMGSEHFTYQQKGHKKITMSYSFVSLEVMHDKEKIREWVYNSVEVSKVGKKSK